MGSQGAGLTAVMAVGSTDGADQSTLPCCPVSRLGGSPARSRFLNSWSIFLEEVVFHW